jgi:hypothetical protein
VRSEEFMSMKNSRSNQLKGCRRVCVCVYIYKDLAKFFSRNIILEFENKRLSDFPS